MATTIFFRALPGATPERCSLGTNSANLAGTPQGWIERFMSATRGSSATSINKSVSAGPTPGQEISASAHWISQALAADVTIAGTITFNVRMQESVSTTNATAQCVIERIDSQGNLQETVVNSEFGTEMTTSEAAQNWTASPTSTVFHRGDRIRARVAANDATALTMGTGTVTFFFDGLSGATGDSFLTFTETLTFLTTDPAGTVIYPTDATAEVNPGGGSYTPKTAWTSRGTGGDKTAVVNTTAGWTPPLLWTKTAGGNFVEWYTPRLAAFTLSGPVKTSLKGLESDANANSAWRLEIAVTASDGTSPVIWGTGSTNSELGTSNGTQLFYVTGDDTAVTLGQRIRIRAYLDDIESAAMGGSFTATFNYNGAAAGTGDSFLTFAETLTTGDQVVVWIG